MNADLNRLSERYRAALRLYLKPGSPASLLPALRLGRRAVILGMETLELARMHRRARASLPAANDRRARNFFTEANAPIKEKHRANLPPKVRGRRVRETAFQKSGRRHRECLEESLQLQKHLRQLTHQVLAAQETERNKISHELQDEIAQTLLGINVRLLSLKMAARKNTKGFKREIASAQQLVVKSARSVRRVAREIRNA